MFPFPSPSLSCWWVREKKKKKRALGTRLSLDAWLLSQPEASWETVPAMEESFSSTSFGLIRVRKAKKSIVSPRLKFCNENTISKRRKLEERGNGFFFHFLKKLGRSGDGKRNILWGWPKQKQGSGWNGCFEFWIEFGTASELGASCIEVALCCNVLCLLILWN